MSKRLNFIIVLYALGIILVVFGHSHYSSGDYSAVYNLINEFIYLFHMPLFFWIAGFLFLNSSSYNSETRWEDYYKWIRKKALRLLVPYFFLSLLFVFPKYYLENGSFNGIGIALLHSIYIPRQSVWGHFWFLPVLFIIYLIFGLFKMVLTSKTEIPITLVSLILGIAFYFMPFESELFGLADLKCFTVYFIIGMASNLVYRRSIVPKILSNCWISLGIAIVILTGGFLIYLYSDNQVVLFIDSILLIFSIVAFSNCMKNIRLLYFIGNNNYTIYLYSWIFQSFVMYGLGKIGAPWYIAFMTMFIVGLGLPLIIVLIYKKIVRIQNVFFDLILGMNKKESI